MVSARHANSLVVGTDLELSSLSIRDCNGETTDLFCYTADNGIPQNVNTSDVQFIANYLRSYDCQIKPGRFFTMLSADTQGCGEWSVYTRKTALATIKHIDDTVDSSILFEDIATAIDGGEKATPEQQAAALLGCGADGGSFAIQANLTNAAAYSSATYIASGYKTTGLLLKIVASGV